MTSPISGENGRFGAGTTPAQSPLSPAYRPFLEPILKVGKGSTAPSGRGNSDRLRRADSARTMVASGRTGVRAKADLLISPVQRTLNVPAATNCAAMIFSYRWASRFLLFFRLQLLLSSPRPAAQPSWLIMPPAAGQNPGAATSNGCRIAFPIVVKDLRWTSNSTHDNLKRLHATGKLQSLYPAGTCDRWSEDPGRRCRYPR